VGESRWRGDEDAREGTCCVVCSGAAATDGQGVGWRRWRWRRGHRATTWGSIAHGGAMHRQSGLTVSPQATVTRDDRWPAARLRPSPPQLLPSPGSEGKLSQLWASRPSYGQAVPAMGHPCPPGRTCCTLHAIAPHARLPVLRLRLRSGIRQLGKMRDGFRHPAASTLPWDLSRPHMRLRRPGEMTHRLQGQGVCEKAGLLQASRPMNRHFPRS
jgi:hypothetical protein